MINQRLVLGLVTAIALGGCDHPAEPPAAPSPAVESAAGAVATETPPAPEASAPAASVSSEPAVPRGKRAPCTTDQSCNRDASVSALWGRCVKETGVCECKPGFELHPGGFCQPIAK